MKNLKELIIEKLQLNKNIEAPKDVDEINDPNYWEVGDILYGTWGYSMNIPIFYKILKRTAQSFTIVELPKKLVSGHYNSYHFEEVPDENKPIKEKPKTVRIKKFGGLAVDRTYLRKWNGKPVAGDDMD